MNEFNEKQEQEIVAIKNRLTDVTGMTEGVVVQNQEDVDRANIVLKRIAGTLKEMEQKRKSFTQPLNQSLKAINDTFKNFAAPLNAAKATLQTKVMDWRRDETKRLQEETDRIEKEEARRRKIQEAHAEKGHEVSKPVEMAKPPELKQTDTTKTRKVWTYKIDSEVTIPREFLKVDEPKITQAIRNGVRVIPGVRIYKKEILCIV